MYPLSSSCSHDRVSAQPGFVLQRSQWYLTQPSSQPLVGNSAVYAISHKRRHQCTDVIVLFPSLFRLFANQMKAGGGHGISLEQPRSISLAKGSIWRGTLGFGMPMVLLKYDFKGLHKYRHSRTSENVGRAVVNVHVGHRHPARRVFLEWRQESERNVGQVHQNWRKCKIVRSCLIAS